MRYFITGIIIVLLTIGGLTSCGGDTQQKSRDNCLQTIKVTNVEQFKTSVAKANPGTIIEVADGDYAFENSPLTIRLRATEKAPIIIRAKNRGKAIFTGEYAVLLEELK